MDIPSLLCVGGTHFESSYPTAILSLRGSHPIAISHILPNQWVVAGEHGWQFPDGDVEALAQGILKAIEQRDVLTRFGQNCRELAEERADWSKNFEKLLEAYEMAIERNDK